MDVSFMYGSLKAITTALNMKWTAINGKELKFLSSFPVFAIKRHVVCRIELEELSV